MKSFAAFLFLSSIASAAIGNAAEPVPVVTEAYAMKDLGVSGMLVIAVIILYRELGKERAKQESRDVETKHFIAEQTRINADAMKAQTDALVSLQNVSKQQVDIYREHINTLVKIATTQAGK